MASFRDLLRASQLPEGKAFNPNAALEDPGRPVGVWDLNLGRIRGGSPTQSIGGRRLSQKNAALHMTTFGGAAAIDWVADCTSYWAGTVGNAEYHFEEPKDPSSIKKPQEAAEAPKDLLDLFEQPNPYQDYIEMLELLTIDLLLVGNAYIFKWKIRENGKPLALYRLAPPYVEVGATPWGPGMYIYQIPNADKIPIEPEELIHLRLTNPDPANPYFGAGIVQTAGRAADLEIALTHTQSAFYKNRALPSVVVETERRVPRDVFKKMRQQIRARAQEPEQAGEVLVLESGLKMQSISPSATDAAFVDVSKMSRDRVFGWFKMHPAQVGITDTNFSAGFLNELNKQWDTKAARPFMNKLQTKITNELTKKPWNRAYVIDYEYQMAPQERAVHAGTVGRIPGISIDEVREAGGLGKHEDPSIGEMAINLPGEEAGTGEPGDPTRNGFPDQNLPGEAGRPPKMSNTRSFPKKGGALPKGTKGRRPEAKALIDEVEARLEALAIGAKALGDPPPKQTNPDQLANIRTADVDTVSSSFENDLATAARVLERGLLDTVEGKALESDVLTKLRNSKAWKSFDALARAAYERALLQVMSATTVHHAKLGLKPKGEVDYDKLVADLVKADKSGVNAITKSFKDIVSATVKEAKHDKADINAAVQQAVSKWTKDRAPMVALTEATRGYNTATIDLAKKADITHVHVTDGDQDEPCAEADGSTWTVEFAADHLLEHPNCRRAFSPVTS